MKEYVLCGAGVYARRFINMVGKERIKFIVDNNKEKSNTFLEGIPIFFYEDKKSELLKYTVIIAVSNKYYEEIRNQLENAGIVNYASIGQIQAEMTKQKIQNRTDNISIYTKAIKWIFDNTESDGGIICNSKLRKGYPEVTGYYIPTLIQWGYRDLAEQFANWLLSIQKENGAWYDTNDKAPYIFDTAQILKGLIAFYKLNPENCDIRKAIVRGCDWILSRMDEDGRLVTPDTECWGNDDKTCSELIHLYCLSPIREAGELFNQEKYIEAVDNIFAFYQETFYDRIMNFSLLSHFYAYIMEALLDLGKVDMCREAMRKIELIQNSFGAVPAYNNVDWVCSTGLFQLALVWYRLGNIDSGNKAFSYACGLQNETGGWFGSYLSENNPNEENTYFPDAEISWANKYFLDALFYKNKAEFNYHASSFLKSISRDDERYVVIKTHIPKNDCKVLDIGCGKGRYLINLLQDLPNNLYYGVDISGEVLKTLKGVNISFCEGTLTNIPYDEKMFDVTYSCEALEHAIDISSAIKEMVRVTKSGGNIIIVDKNDDAYGTLEIGEWEQWPNEIRLQEIMKNYCSDVELIHGLKYENMINSNLFSAWIGKVK